MLNLIFKELVPFPSDAVGVAGAAGLLNQLCQDSPPSKYVLWPAVGTVTVVLTLFTRFNPFLKFAKTEL